MERPSDPRGRMLSGIDLIDADCLARLRMQVTAYTSERALRARRDERRTTAGRR